MLQQTEFGLKFGIIRYYHCVYLFLPSVLISSYEPYLGIRTDICKNRSVSTPDAAGWVGDSVDSWPATVIKPKLMA